MYSAFQIELVDALIPERLAATRRWVATHVNGMVDALDRRGFQLQQWPQYPPSGYLKPNELSLEHEARLLPADLPQLFALQDKLYQSEGQSAGKLLLPGNSTFGSLVVKRYERSPGFQSVDRYYDVSSLAFTIQMITVRQRIRTSSFMTWSVDDNVARPLNMELPFLSAGHNGMNVRLEFNWIDDLMNSWKQYQDIHAEMIEDQGNPFFIAKQHYQLPVGELIPIVEHTTFREKFGFWETLPDGGLSELFVINIDHVTAQSLSNYRLNSYTDIDISAVRAVDEPLLQSLDAFAGYLSALYALTPNNATKAYRDAQLLGMIV